MHIARSRLAALGIGAAVAASLVVAGPAAAHEGHDHEDEVAATTWANYERVTLTKDVGEPTPSGNKTPFQLEAGLYFNVPLQRNKAQGKLREAQGKLAQIAAKRRLVENKIVIDVQDALSDLTTSYERFLRARENAQLAWELATAERERFELEDSD